MTCLAVWAPIRPKCSPSSCSVSTRSPGLRVGLDLARVVERELGQGILDLGHGVAGAEHADGTALRVDLDVDVLFAGDAAICSLDALLQGTHQDLSGNLLLRVELEERTDEVSTHECASHNGDDGTPLTRRNVGGHPRLGAAASIASILPRDPSRAKSPVSRPALLG